MGTGFSKKKKEAKLLQQQFSQIQSQMESAEFTGSAANGLVTIVMSGDGELKKIKIQPECVDQEDIEGLETLIKAAYEDVHNKIKEQQSKAMPGLPPGFPSFGK